jgi:hypothetical protein
MAQGVESNVSDDESYTTSLDDLIDGTCSPSCKENVVVETCNCLIGKKNDELKQEVK